MSMLRKLKKMFTKKDRIEMATISIEKDSILFLAINAIHLKKLYDTAIGYREDDSLTKEQHETLENNIERIKEYYASIVEKLEEQDFDFEENEISKTLQ